MAKARAASRKQPNVVTRYFRESATELRKVSWPTRDEATRLTIIVLVVLTFSSSVLGLLDYLYSRLFAYIITLG